MNKFKNMEYAIVDIETTGGHARSSRMTEIAILIHNGHHVVERWESLINPEQDIPLAIFALTGIDNDLVANAPVFGDIAQHVFDLLEGRIFVAHNVNFDYSFIRHQLEEEGFKWGARKLCTVRLSRKIKPGFPSYSLGKLCDDLGIPISNRHRAGGDAEATALLFASLLESDHEGVLEEMLKKTSTDQRFPPNLAIEDFEALPAEPGVYYFLNQQGKVIYVGKAVHLKKRVASHFTGHSIHKQRQHFLKEIYHITFEVCATELMALLLECTEIKRLWPAYNRALKRFEPKFGLFRYEAQNGYHYLAVGKLKKHCPCLQTFNVEYEGIHVLRQLMINFELDPRMCMFAASDTPYANRIKETDVSLPNIEAHNAQVDLAVDHLLGQQQTFVIVDKGRTLDEKSYVWVEQGNFYAMGYLDHDAQLASMEDIRSSLKRYYGNHYMMQLINSYVSKYPRKVTYLNDCHKAVVLPEVTDDCDGESLILF